HISGAAELAGYGDLAVLDHVVAVLGGEAPEHVFDVFPGARALCLHRRGAEHAHAVFVKQIVGETLARDCRIDQLDVVDSGDKRAAFYPRFVLVDRVRLGAGRRVAGIEIGLARAVDRLGQELKQDATGAPAPPGTVLAGAELLGDREPRPRRY